MESVPEIHADDDIQVIEGAMDKTSARLDAHRQWLSEIERRLNQAEK